jgi:hypothetical protein
MADRGQLVRAERRVLGGQVNDELAQARRQGAPVAYKT